MKEFKEGVVYKFTREAFIKDCQGRIIDNESWINECDGKIVVDGRLYGYRIHPDWCEEVEEEVRSPKVCPVMSRPTDDFRDGLNEIHCLEERCGWWNGEHGICAIPMLAITVLERSW